MEYRNGQRTRNAAIDCEINHPVYGWIPFTCDSEDTGAQFDVAELHARLDADPDTAPYIPPTQAELDELAARKVRGQRNLILSFEFDPLISNPLRWGDLTAEQQQAWADYRRALLDIPQQAGFPQDVIWPKSPG